LTLVACNGNTNKEVQLPVLNGLTKTQIIAELDSLGANYEFTEEINFNIPEDSFIRYGNGLSAGMLVNLSETDLLIYISIHKILLPDLSGRTEIQAAVALTNLNLQYNVTYRDSTEHNEGTVIEYGGTFEVGQELQAGSIVSIVIARYPSAYRSPIYISKYASGTGFNRAIEIYNSLDKEVSLEGYKLSFYLDGAEEESNAFVIPEGTKLGANDTLLIVHPDASNEMKQKADILSDELTFVGKDYIKLLDHKGSFIDEFGFYKVYVMFFANRIMVRNQNIVESNLEFVNSEWDTYHRDYFEILDSHPTPFPQSFTFLQEDLELPGGFDTPRGMSLVVLDGAGVVDGDTAYFSPGFMGDERVRFGGINAREISAPDPKDRALAEQAKNYLDSLLSNASAIYVQHDPYLGPVEHYGRSLGLVWADGVLTNYQMMLMGHSENNYADPNEHFIYNGVTLNEWFRRAEASARAQRIGIWA
ncbi:MAG: lamin tail domain-containing protein, partial [Acholeplasmataceae bacterium]|nr:lamin tail domain-containing protein [Acholeplasmataceae bacterium]